jgi:hypothetical protein
MLDLVKSSGRGKQQIGHSPRKLSSGCMNNLSSRISIYIASAKVAISFSVNSGSSLIISAIVLYTVTYDDAADDSSDTSTLPILHEIACYSAVSCKMPMRELSLVAAERGKGKGSRNRVCVAYWKAQNLGDN